MGAPAPSIEDYLKPKASDSQDWKRWLSVFCLGILFVNPFIVRAELSTPFSLLHLPDETLVPSESVPIWTNSSIFFPAPSPSPRPINAFLDFFNPPAAQKPLPQISTTVLDFLKPRPPLGVQVAVDLSRQRLTLFRYKRVILESPISSGQARHPTTTGNFEITQKDLHHFSTLYGQFVSRTGTVVGGGSSRRVPRGCRFKPAPMKYFLRFNGAEGFHAGALPGYPASHGCVRLPANKAAAIFKTVGVGTPVIVTKGNSNRIKPTKTRKTLFASSSALPPTTQKKSGLPMFLTSEKKQ